MVSHQTIRYFLTGIATFIAISFSNAFANTIQPAQCGVKSANSYDSRTPDRVCRTAAITLYDNTIYYLMGSNVHRVIFPGTSIYGDPDFYCLYGKSQSQISLYLKWLNSEISQIDWPVEVHDELVGAFGAGLGGCTCRYGREELYINADGTVAECRDKANPTLILTLTPAPYQNEPRPKEIEGKDGKSTFDLIAKVTENGSPKAGVTVTFASKVEANSGGHDHHDASRPKGDVPASGETDTNGEIKITFQAPLFAGKHTVEATCDSCSNKTVTHSLDVKVLNLTQLTGGGSGTLYKLVGDDGNHGSNHWFSYKAKDALIQLLSIFKEYGWGVVGVNDSSLMWGGCFDVPGRWGACKRNHAGHRTGEEVDLSFYRPSGVSKDLRKKIYNDLKDSHKIELPTILWHVNDKPNPDPTKPPLSYAHFHVYLLGQKQFNETPY